MADDTSSTSPTATPLSTAGLPSRATERRAPPPASFSSLVSSQQLRPNTRTRGGPQPNLRLETSQLHPGTTAFGGGAGVSPELSSSRSNISPGIHTSSTFTLGNGPPSSSSSFSTFSRSGTRGGASQAPSTLAQRVTADESSRTSTPCSSDSGASRESQTDMLSAELFKVSLAVPIPNHKREASMSPRSVEAALNASGTSEGTSRVQWAGTLGPVEGPAQGDSGRIGAKRNNQNTTPHAIRQLKEGQAFNFRGAVASPSLFIGIRRRTLVIYPPACLHHNTANHQESTERLKVLCGPHGVLRRPRFKDLEWVSDFNHPAPMGDILRVHDHEYISHLKQIVAKLPSPSPNKAATMAMGVAPSDEDEDTMKVDPLDGPQSPRDLRRRPTDNPRQPAGPYASTPAFTSAAPALPPEAVSTTQPISFLDPDTQLCKGSYWAASVAAGAVIEAVDRAASGLNRFIFVAVRPPGHHAGCRGAVPATSFWKAPLMCSSGFCLLNNVAIGAAYARAMYGRRDGRFKKIAIIDFDIHHGNGTEDIVKNLRPQRRRLPLPSSWAPMEYEVYKPWLDESDPDNVFFGSINLVNGEAFYPCSGFSSEDDPAKYPNIVNIELSPFNVPAGDRRARQNMSKNKRKEFCEKASAEFRSKVSAVLLPRLRAFCPDLLFISSGFDGHQDDLYHFLTSEDYRWITQQLVQVMEMTSGPVISVLEGGYHVRAEACHQPHLRHKRVGNKVEVMRHEEVASSEDEGGVGGGEALWQPQDGGLAKGVVAHVLELMQEGEDPSAAATS